MPGDPDIAAVAAVVGEPTRARILMALLTERMFGQGWITRPDARQRAIALTDDGRAGIHQHLRHPRG
jgi:hypothetical protein